MNLRVWYTDKYTDEKGEHWFAINGHQHYSLSSGWTEESAIADYTSEQNAIDTANSDWEAFCN